MRNIWLLRSSTQKKAFDRIPMEAIRWIMGKSCTYEWLVRTDMALYSEACAVVRTGHGDSNSFDVKVVACQRSIVSPLLFAIVIDMVKKKRREENCPGYCYI